MKSYTIQNQDQLHYLTFTTVGWIDIFTRRNYKELLIESLQFCIDEKKVIILAYVIMSNHIHLLARSEHKNGLSGFVRDFKQFTAKNIHTLMLKERESRKEWLELIMEYHAKYKASHQNFQLWQLGCHAIELYSPEWINQKMNYIHLNPVRAGLVYEAEDYYFSSARFYSKQEEPLIIEPLETYNTIGFIS